MVRDLKRRADRKGMCADGHHRIVMVNVSLDQSTLITLPGLIISGILVFVGSLTAYTTPALLGGKEPVN
ncbi:hypothetical protein A3842_01305 [Paenibacillus sp. P3E]|nr:hypothetical protein A3842_01305 [Paenibacillus sp. P3E]